MYSDKLATCCISRYYTCTAASQTEDPQPREKVEQIQQESTEKLEHALDDVEENLDAQASQLLKHVKYRVKKTRFLLPFRMCLCSIGLIVDVLEDHSATELQPDQLPQPKQAMISLCGFYAKTLQPMGRWQKHSVGWWELTISMSSSRRSLNTLSLKCAGAPW